MTKSRRSATKLRLSKLFRWLAVLCFIKLAIFGLIITDVPLPGLFSEKQPQKEAPLAVNALPEPTPARENEISEDAALPAAPQGSDAARLAASIKPAASRRIVDMSLPAPVINNAAPAPQFPAGATLSDSSPKKSSETENASPMLSHPDIPLPAPLPAPVAEPGVPAPNPEQTQADRGEGLLDVLGLKNLPIPQLGSIRAANAAALDMPVPQTPVAGQSSPFAPMEQSAPLTMPGAPDIPANIPRGQGSDGAPLPERGATRKNAETVPSRSMPDSMPVPVTQMPTSRINSPNENLQELARQQQDTLMLKQQMDARLEELRASEQKVKDMLREAKGVEDAKLRSLLLMYGNMKPKTAAKALETMDERVAIQILKGLTPKQSGEILSYTNPSVTAKLTEMLTRVRLPE